MPRTEVAIVPLLAAAVVLAGVACGKSGSRATRPAEVLYRVSGTGGTRFRFATPADACAGASGIQAPNAIHQFGDRVFESPHFFILENVFQPIQAAFIVPDEEPDPIRVDLFLGLEERRAVEIAPGECGLVDTGTPQAQAGRRDIRIELCGSTSSIPRGAHCGDFRDDFVGFFVSLGDSTATNVTSCSARPVAEACRTPATLFVEDAREQLTAVFDTLSGESPNAILLAELYVDDVLVDSNKGARNVVLKHDL
jgi:hypothetical protein